MRGRTSILLFVASTWASVCAYRSLLRLPGLVAGNYAIQHAKENRTWLLGWLLCSVVLSVAFVFTARGRWRFAAGIPLVICGFVAFGVTVFW